MIVNLRCDDLEILPEYFWLDISEIFHILSKSSNPSNKYLICTRWYRTLVPVGCTCWKYLLGISKMPSIS